MVAVAGRGSTWGRGEAPPVAALARRDAAVWGKRRFQGREEVTNENFFYSPMSLAYQ
jgi:hypothetical protein